MANGEFILSNKESLERELREIIAERRVSVGQDYYGLIFKNLFTGKVDVEVALGWGKYDLSDGGDNTTTPMLNALKTWLPEDYEVGPVLTELLVEYLGDKFHCYEYGVNSVFLVFPTALIMAHRNVELN